MILDMIVTTRDFFDKLKMVADKWKRRKERLTIRMDVFESLFERELEIMREHCVHNFKSKKYKQMHQKLNAITRRQKDAIIEEYFSLCKLIMNQELHVRYIWRLTGDVNSVRALITGDDNFDAVHARAYKSFMRLFAGTRNEKTVGQLKRDEPKSSSPTM